MGPRKNRYLTPRETALIGRHVLHEGLYTRLARKLGVDALYVSKVVSDPGISQKVYAEVITELERIERTYRAPPARR